MEKPTTKEMLEKQSIRKVEIFDIVYRSLGPSTTLLIFTLFRDLHMRFRDS